MKTTASQLRHQRGQHPGGVLVVEDRDDRDHAVVRRRRTRAATRPAPPSPRGCARRRAASADRRRRSAAARARGSGPPPRPPRPRRARPGTPRRRPAPRRSCAAGTTPARRPRRPGRRRRWTIVAPRSAADARRACLERVGVQVGSEHQRPALLDDRELLAGDVGDRRAQPARVLEADAGQHLDARRDHVGGVVAAAEPGLDHRHLDARGAPAPSRRPRSAPRTG